MWTVMGWLLAVVCLVGWFGARGRVARLRCSLFEVKLEKEKLVDDAMCASARATEQIQRVHALITSIDKEASERAQRIIDEMSVEQLFAEFHKRPGAVMLLRLDEKGRYSGKYELIGDVKEAQWIATIETKVLPLLRAIK